MNERHIIMGLLVLILFTVIYSSYEKDMMHIEIEELKQEIEELKQENMRLKLENLQYKTNSLNLRVEATDTDPALQAMVKAHYGGTK